MQNGAKWLYIGSAAMASKLEAAGGQIECTAVWPVIATPDSEEWTRQRVLPSTVREPRHTTRCRLRTERDASIDFSAVCGTVVECTPSNVRRGLPGKTANTSTSPGETRLVDTVPSGIEEGRFEDGARFCDDRLRILLCVMFRNLLPFEGNKLFPSRYSNLEF